uniref:Uncharacterized protein n=1 Tax=Peronospora matthiolae TaxID=2874970 RepID=A0AAV1V048_9STRA
MASQVNRHAKIGYVFGYAADVLGCKLYFPDDCTRKFVPDNCVNEHVLYRDRHTTTATLSEANSDVNASIEEGDYVAEIEATDSIIDDDDILTDAQDAGKQDSVWTRPVGNRGTVDSVHRNVDDFGAGDSDCRISNMAEFDGDSMEEDDAGVSGQVEEDLQGGMSCTSSHISSIDGYKARLSMMQKLT